MAIAVWGCGELAKTFSAYVPPNFFVADKEFIPEDGTYLNRKVYELDDLHAFSYAIEIYIPVSYKRCNKDREDIFNKVKAAKFKIASYVHPTAYVDSTVEYGEGTIIFPLNNVDPNVKMGRGNLLWGKGHLGHSSTIGDFNFISTGAVISGCCKIGNNCFFGVNSSVKDNIEIPDGTVLGQGAILTKSPKEPYQVFLAGVNNLYHKSALELC